MFFLSLGSFFLLASACFGCLHALLKDRRAEERLRLDLIESTCQGWEDRRETLRRETRELNHVLTRTIRMYETARDICATLEEEELLARFQANLKKFVSHERCYLVDSRETPLPPQGGRRVYPLESHGASFGALVIEGLAESAGDFPEALVRPFVLGLRRSRLYRMVQELAITDALTGLYTRRYAFERMGEEFRRCEEHGLSLAVLMIDVDDFKACNDAFGHLVGDVVLDEIGARIRGAIREVDMVARYGGEEFLVFAPATSRESALRFAQRIRAAVRDREIRAYDERLKMTVSVGVASFPGDASRAQELVDRADEAMYRAKRLGKDRVVAFEAG